MNTFTSIRTRRPAARVIERPPRDGAIVEFLRSMVVAPPGPAERFHALYLDSQRGHIGDAPLGRGTGQSLTLRMREVFERALALDAQSIVLAHNHPSGECRPSQRDIEATGRLNAVANALDIEILDHLIFTHDAVYSMRAGGKL